MVDVDAVAGELYGLPPGEFTAARNDQAKAARKAGEREAEQQIKALRRPTQSAWASNLLVREHPQEARSLIELGQALRQAHQNLDGEQLRDLGRRQHVLIAALSRQARQLTAEAGQRIGADAQREVEETLHAVLADPQAAQQWAHGRLVKPLSAATGFAEAATGTTIPLPTTRPARPARKPPAKRPPGKRKGATVSDLDAARERRAEQERRERERREQLQRARTQAEEAEQRLKAAEEDYEGAQHEADAAEQDLERLDERISELSEELKRAQAQQRQARSRERETRGRVREADRAVREARRQAEDAAAHLQRLTRHTG